MKEKVPSYGTKVACFMRSKQSKAVRGGKILRVDRGGKGEGVGQNRAPSSPLAVFSSSRFPQYERIEQSNSKVTNRLKKSVRIFTRDNLKKRQK